MKCPIDNTELKITDRQGIEIDYCPQCRGVWLDRGELDKIIERTGPSQRDTSNDRGSRRRHDDDDDRRGGFFSNLFDFD
jgi:Zn-finger nucleic acid-binding protein